MAKRVLIKRRIWNTIKLPYCTYITDAGQLEAPEQVVPCLAPLTREKQTDGERQRERDIEQRLTRLDQAWSAVRDIGTAMHPPFGRGIMPRLVSSRLVMFRSRSRFTWKTDRVELNELKVTSQYRIP